MRRRKHALAAGGLALISMATAGCVSFGQTAIPYVALEAKYANPADRFVDLPDGLHLRYRDQGKANGPPIVLVHGFSASLETWEPWAKRLSADYRIVSLDLPGHGLTRAPADYVGSLDRYAEVVDAVAARLGLGPYVVVGNSMGGGVAWTLALRHPEHLRALVLVDSIAPPNRKRQAPALTSRMIGGSVVRGIMRDVDVRPLAERGLKSAYVDTALVTPELVDRYVDMSRAPGHRDLLLKSQAGMAGSVEVAALGAIKTPTLVMHGEADAIIPPAVGRSLASAIPGARLITYPGGGHVPMEQTPERSAADVKAFMDGLAPG